MARKRPCRICRKWFSPQPRAGDRQHICSDPGCQTERHRRACASWRRRHPDYDREDRLRRRLLRGVRSPPGPLTADPLRRIDWKVARDAVGLEVGQSPASVGARRSVPASRWWDETCALTSPSSGARRHRPEGGPVVQIRVQQAEWTRGPRAPPTDPPLRAPADAVPGPGAGAEAAFVFGRARAADPDRGGLGGSRALRGRGRLQARPGDAASRLRRGPGRLLGLGGGRGASSWSSPSPSCSLTRPSSVYRGWRDSCGRRNSGSTGRRELRPQGDKPGSDRTADEQEG